MRLGADNRGFRLVAPAGRCSVCNRAVVPIEMLVVQMTVGRGEWIRTQDGYSSSWLFTLHAYGMYHCLLRSGFFVLRTLCMSCSGFNNLNFGEMMVRLHAVARTTLLPRTL